MKIHVDLLYLNFLVSTALPALTAFITHRYAGKGFKAVILVVLSLAGGVANEMIQQGGNFSLTQSGIWAVITFMSAAVLHSGLLKPLGVTGSEGLIAKTFSRGLGKPATVAGPTSMG